MGRARNLSLIVAGSVALTLMSPVTASASTATVSTFAQLQAAAETTGATGDVITLANDIVMTARLTLSAGVTIDGNGHTLTVPVPGVTEAGLNAASPSGWGLFDVTSSDMVTLRELTLLGGNSSSGAISVASGARLTIFDSHLERSRNSFGGGGAVYNAGELTIVDSYLRRNSARWGGAVINALSGLLVMDRSTLAENRTEDSNGGGGGVENQGTMWLTNATFANNMTTAGGGAINNYMGTLYVSHSSFVGNVSTGPYDGGAILSFSGGTATVVSSLFAYNYSTNSAGTAFFLDDFASPNVSSPLSVASSIAVAYSLVQTADSWPAAINDTNVTDYAASADGSTDTLFSGGTYAYPTDGTGAVVTALGRVFRPNLVLQGGLPTAALVSLSTPGLTGAPVVFTPTTAFGYYSAATSSWVYTVGSGSGPQNQTTDQVGTTRSTTVPTAGALEGTVAPTFLVTSPVVTGGSVSGASAYGDPYPAGAGVTIVAIPDSGYTVSQWSVAVGSAPATAPTVNPLALTVSDTTVVTPVFAVAAAGVRTVTYAGTGADAGSPPAAVTGSAPIAIAATAGTLTRAGFTLAGWNDAANGSGTAYALGQTYSDPDNLTLYPVWAAAATHVVTYDAQGGSAVAAGSFVSGGYIAAAPTAPTRAGFTFDGWAATSGGPAVTFPYAPGVNAPVTLFARWTAVAAAPAPAAQLASTGLEVLAPALAALALLLAGGILAVVTVRRRRAS